MYITLSAPHRGEPKNSSIVFLRHHVRLSFCCPGPYGAASLGPVGTLFRNVFSSLLVCHQIYRSPSCSRGFYSTRDAYSQDLYPYLRESNTTVASQEYCSRLDLLILCLCSISSVCFSSSNVLDFQRFGSSLKSLALASWTPLAPTLTRRSTRAEYRTTQLH